MDLKFGRQPLSEVPHGSSLLGAHTAQDGLSVLGSAASGGRAFFASGFPSPSNSIFRATMESALDQSLDCSQPSRGLDAPCTVLPDFGGRAINPRDGNRTIPVYR